MGIPIIYQIWVDGKPYNADLTYINRETAKSIITRYRYTHPSWNFKLMWKVQYAPDTQWKDAGE